MVALGIASVVLVVALPNIVEWANNQRAKAAARSVADLLQMARAEAMRTGNRHVVFFGNPGTTDPSGNQVAMGAAWVPVLLIDDGAPVAANCAIDGGETLEAVQPEDGVSWGVSFATSAVATDGGSAPFDPGGPWDGATFTDPANAKINWVLFGPDGIPVTFVGAVGSCGLLGNLGSAGGALYLTNGERDFAIVLSPLGAVRLHVWNGASGAWSS
jgi:type II secretory pathway pseudopilin PulG